jgi:hypothetical protein
MSDDTIDPHAAKLLGDLLALVLSENQGQAEAAIGAIRRRAARDGVSAGALKQVANQLLSSAPADGGAAARELIDLRRTNVDQSRELERARDARRRAEMALTNVQRANQSLAANVGRLRDGRRNLWQMGFVLGAGIVAAGFITYGVVTRFGAPVGQNFDRPARAELADFLHSCFQSSSNSLAGEPFGLRLLIDVDADGRITTARIAPGQEKGADADQEEYGNLLLRTLNSGSCGSLPLPSSLRGKAGRLELYLPR